MEIIKFEYFNSRQLTDNLRKMHLKGQPDKRIYENADIWLEEKVNTDDIVIPQYYVLEKDLQEISDCRQALLEFGVDIFHLKGFLRVYSRGQKGQIQVFDVLPPVVEISDADGGIPLLNDGMHRIYLARRNGSSINVVMVRGVDPRYPYYALPNQGGWDNVRRCDEVPDIKKNYRVADYKTLFRDFNTCFLNVTQSRTDKKPAKLVVQGEKVTVNG